MLGVKSYRHYTLIHHLRMVSAVAITRETLFSLGLPEARFHPLISIVVIFLSQTYLPMSGLWSASRVIFTFID